MLITQKMELMKLSSNEELIYQFILNHPEQLERLTIKQIASQIYVSPALFIVFAKKLGYSGWNEFKQDFIEERKYLDSHFQEIDPNRPFSSQDNIMNIAYKIATLQNETIQDTLELIHHDNLQKATQLLKKSLHIYLFGSNMSYIASQEFFYSMKRLGVHIEYNIDPVEQIFQTQMMPPQSVAIVISYTGETAHVLKICQDLYQQKVPIITITGFGENTVMKYSDVALYMSTRENVHTKISTFSTRQSIHTILDILYSCYFAFHYQENYEKVVETNNSVEYKRFSSNTEINQ